MAEAYRGCRRREKNARTIAAVRERDTFSGDAHAPWPICQETVTTRPDGASNERSAS